MKYAVSINELSKKIKVHAFNCNFSNESEKENISEYCNSYEDAWNSVSNMKLEEDYAFEDCNCCNPGDWCPLE